MPQSARGGAREPGNLVRRQVGTTAGHSFWAYVLRGMGASVLHRSLPQGQPAKTPGLGKAARCALIPLAAVLLGAQDTPAQWSSRTSNTNEDLSEAFFVTAAIATAAGDNGIVVRTTDTGSTWSTSASPAGPTTEDLKNIVFLSPTVGVGIGKNGAMVRSTDGGATWSAISIPGSKELTAINFSGTTVIAVGKKNGAFSTLIFSTDSGVTWFSGTVAANPGTDLAGVVVLSATNAVAVGKRAGSASTILRTTDSGLNWSVQPVTGDPGKDLQDIDASGATLVAVGKKSGGASTVLRSTDSGVTWSVRSVGSDPGQDLNKVAFINGATWVAVGNNGTILRSTDGGATWTSVTSPAAAELTAIHRSGTTVIAVGKRNGAVSTIAYSTDSGASWASGVVAADPGQDLNDVTVLSGTVAIAVGKANGAVSTVLRTTNSGANWTLQSITDDLGEDLEEVVGNGGTTVIAIGQNGSFVRSTDSGATWANPIHTSPAALLNGIASSGTTVIAVGDQAGNSNVTYSTDQGLTWLTGAVAADPQENLNDVVALSATNAIAIGQNAGGTSTVLRTTNSGANWTVRTVTGDPGKELLAVASSGANVVSVGTNAGGTSTVLRSADSGASWSLQSVTGDPGQPLNAVAFLTGANVVAVGKAGTILRSTNGGATWAVVGAAVTGSELKGVAVDAGNATRVLAVGKNGTLVRSTDSGATWAVVGAAVTGRNLNAVVYNGAAAMAVGDAGTIVRSTDGGVSWATDASLATSNLNDIIYDGSTGLVIGDAGTIRRTAPVIGVSPASLSFGNVNVGASPTLSITVSNSGLAPLTVSNITSTDGEFAPDITAFVVAAGGNRTVNVTFTPTWSGPRSANLTITHDATTGLTTVPMSGSVIGTNIGVSPGSLSFGNTVILASGVLSLTVTNSGAPNLVVSNITSDDGQFVPDVTSFTVTQGGSQIVNVTFTPTTPGSKSGTLTITHNAAGGTSTVSMAGDGTVGISAPLGLAFGGVTLADSASLPLVLSNPSAVPLTVTSITSSHPAFVPDLTTFLIAPGGNQVLNVIFAPTYQGDYSGVLSITHNPTVTMSMSGSGGAGAAWTTTRRKENPLTIIVPFGGEVLLSLLVGAYGLHRLRRSHSTVPGPTARALDMKTRHQRGC